MRLRCVAFATAAGLAGCAEYDHMRFTDVQGATDRADLSNEGITLVHGFAVAARGAAYDSDDDVLANLTLHTDDSAPIGIAPGPNAGTYVFYGRTVGTGQLRVRIDGDQVATIPVTVVAQ